MYDEAHRTVQKAEILGVSKKALFDAVREAVAGTRDDGLISDVSEIGASVIRIEMTLKHHSQELEELKKRPHITKGLIKGIAEACVHDRFEECNDRFARQDPSTVFSLPVRPPERLRPEKRESSFPWSLIAKIAIGLLTLGVSVYISKLK